MVKCHNKGFKENALQYLIEHPSLGVFVVFRKIKIANTTDYFLKNKVEKNENKVNHFGLGSYVND